MSLDLIVFRLISCFSPSLSILERVTRPNEKHCPKHFTVCHHYRCRDRWWSQSHCSAAQQTSFLHNISVVCQWVVYSVLNCWSPSFHCTNVEYDVLWSTHSKIILRNKNNEFFWRIFHLLSDFVIQFWPLFVWNIVSFCEVSISLALSLSDQLFQRTFFYLMESVVLRYLWYSLHRRRLRWFCRLISNAWILHYNSVVNVADWPAYKKTEKANSHNIWSLILNRCICLSISFLVFDSSHYLCCSWKYFNSGVVFANVSSQNIWIGPLI